MRTIVQVLFTVCKIGNIHTDRRGFLNGDCVIAPAISPRLHSAIPVFIRGSQPETIRAGRCGFARQHARGCVHRKARRGRGMCRFLIGVRRKPAFRNQLGRLIGQPDFAGRQVGGVDHNLRLRNIDQRTTLAAISVFVRGHHIKPELARFFRHTCYFSRRAVKRQPIGQHAICYAVDILRGAAASIELRAITLTIPSVGNGRTAPVVDRDCRL